MSEMNKDENFLASDISEIFNLLGNIIWIDGVL